MNLSRPCRKADPTQPSLYSKSTSLYRKLSCSLSLSLLAPIIIIKTSSEPELDSKLEACPDPDSESEAGRPFFCHVRACGIIGSILGECCRASPFSNLLCDSFLDRRTKERRLGRQTASKLATISTSAHTSMVCVMLALGTLWTSSTVFFWGGRVSRVSQRFVEADI
jgi:hypothetical protein